MSLKSETIPSVPDDTTRVARAAFPHGNPYLTLRDTLGRIFADADFAALFPACGQPGLPPWRLALVTILQFRENLADRQAAEAVRARIDWKYLLGLELTDPGFDFSVLSEFRDRLLAGAAEDLLLEKLLEQCRAFGLLKTRGQQRTDSTHVVAAIRVLSRLELVGETLRAALNELATVAPDWLQGLAPVAWYERYGKRIEDARLPRSPRQSLLYTGAHGSRPTRDTNPLRMRSMICLPGPWRRVPATTVSSRRQPPGPHSRRPATPLAHHALEGDIMGTADNKQLMQHLFTEMATGNFEPFLTNMADDIRWTVMGTTKFSGTLTGKQEVINKRLTPIIAQLDGPIIITAQNFIAEGDSVVVEGHGQAMTKAGKPYNNTYCFIFRLANGKVQELAEYLDTEMVTAAFGQ
jgi:ketosteroid isomerase-like protein/transposase